MDRTVLFPPKTLSTCNAEISEISLCQLHKNLKVYIIAVHALHAAWMSFRLAVSAEEHLLKDPIFIVVSIMQAEVTNRNR